MAEEEAEKSEKIEKKAVKEEKKKKVAKSAIPKKLPYTVKVEVMAPVELTYRVWAENPEQAVEMLRYGMISAPPKPILSKQRRIKATVYKYGTVMIEFIKKFT